MPKKRNNSEPPEVMTWGRAALALVPAVIFDALRLMFSMFWFFGPILVGVGVGAATSGFFGSGPIGSAVGDVVGTAAAVVTGFFGGTALVVFGVVMAMAVGLAGWLVVGLIILGTNSRMFKEGFLLFAGSLLASVVPFINSLPVLTGITWRMYHVQIKKDTAARKKWEKENAEAEIQERQRRAARFMQERAAQLAQAEQQEAANDELYAQQAANDEKYNNEEIPEKVRTAA